MSLREALLAEEQEQEQLEWQKAVQIALLSKDLDLTLGKSPTQVIHGFPVDKKKATHLRRVILRKKNTLRKIQATLVDIRDAIGMSL